MSHELDLLTCQGCRSRTVAVERLRSDLATARERVKVLEEALGHAYKFINYRRHPCWGNAPGHAHSRPGIWDDDNGEKAGKPCSWCQTGWPSIERALATTPREP